MLLSEEKYQGWLKEYASRAVQAGINRFLRAATARPSKTRRYARSSRKSLYDRVGGSPWDRPQRLHRMIAEHEFPWVVLKGEFDTIMDKNLNREAAITILRERYHYLPHVRRERFPMDLLENPSTLAYAEIIEDLELGIEPESLPSLLSRAPVPDEIRQWVQPRTRKLSPTIKGTRSRKLRK
ncbi:MAG: hypothetical protein HYZ11_17995 [Candidatus Tectomicrobia bacterium]|uniref:Uncharacterized protein n=1 Tax=Tectimicrobiota bacterium TaxID=2528274 RepID=A0A932MNM0_UNCTE|nr:hypothetical protein [Candidatus Tectomicrobia bacterium]